MKRIIELVLTLLLMLNLPFAAFAEGGAEATVLFTNDLHSHFLPSPDGQGGEFGGYARLMTAIKAQKELAPDAILVDGGDFSMGSLFQTAYPTSALELRMMGAMGYDATTFGNHEFDYLPAGLTAMLNAAVASGDRLPALLTANYQPPREGEEGYNPELLNAMDNYGVKEYMLLERGGIHYALFGIFGIDSDDCAPNSGMILQDAAERAQAVVDQAVAECKETYGAEPIVVCLSHSGTEDEAGEDYELAKAVNGIDLIISGHTHTTLEEPIKVNDTYIVAAGEYGKYLGVATLSAGEETALTDYQLIPIDETVAEDPAIAARVEKAKSDVEKNYLTQYGLTFDEVLLQNDITFDTVDDVYATQHESTLCNVFSDAYKWAAELATGETVDMALTAAGVIRESLPLGKVTVSDVFNAASLGVGTEGELIAVYITGKDLKNALEVDASVQPLMSSAQLFCSGVEYSFNTNRMIFNKVDYAMLRRADGTTEEIKDDQLYRIVTGMYAGQMLGAVESTSMGLLSITPRDADGNPIAPDKLVNFVIKDQEGKPVKEWYAIATYLLSMGGKMDPAYAAPDGRKVVYSSLSLQKLLSNANGFTYALLGAILLVLVLIALAIWLILRKIKKKKAVTV